MELCDFLNEGYTPIARKLFSSRQLKEIGDVLSNNFGVSVQNSDVQHWKAKDFKLRMALENHVAICKLIDGNYAILDVMSPQNARVIKTTSDIIKKPNTPQFVQDFLPVKEIIKLSTDVFTLNTADNIMPLKVKRVTRAISGEDPLIMKSRYLKDKIKDYELKKPFKESLEYIKNLNKKLNLYGIIVTDAYIIEYSEGMREVHFKTKIDSSKFKYGSIFIETTTQTNQKKLFINYSIHLQNKVITEPKEIDRMSSELSSLKSITTILDSIDFNKLIVKYED